MAITVMFHDGLSYPANTIDNFFEDMLVASLAGRSGVFRGVGNQLAVSGTSSPVTVKDGACCVKGKWVSSSADTSVDRCHTRRADRCIDRIIVKFVYATGVATINDGHPKAAEPIPHLHSLTRQPGCFAWRISASPPAASLR